MKKLLQFLTICAVLIITAGNVWATDYYVATTGNNGNTGGLSDPWLTIQHAVNSVSTGDFINVAAGTYPEGIIEINKNFAYGGT